MTEAPTDDSFHSSFLGSYEDVIIFVSCVCGILGVILLVAVVFFILKTCEALEVEDPDRKRRLYNSKAIDASRVQTRYPVWLREEQALPGSSKKQRGLSISFDPSVKFHDEKTTRNESRKFKKVSKKKANKNGLRVDYENKAYAQEKRFVLPSFLVGYGQAKTGKKNQNYFNSPSGKNQIKVSLEDELVDFSRDKSRGILSIPQDDFNPKEIRMQEALQKQMEEEKKYRVSAMIALEKPVRPDVVVARRWSTEYENPKWAAEERRREKKEMEEREEMIRNRSRRKVVVRNDDVYNAEEVKIEKEKQKRRIKI